jgi:putative ABC transport system permease protein
MPTDWDLLTAFGVFWGIFILVLLLALTNGLRTGVSKRFGDFAANSMFLWAQSTSMPYKSLKRGRRFDLKLSDVAALRKFRSRICFTGCD